MNRCSLFRGSLQTNAIAAMGKFLPEDKARFGLAIMNLVNFNRHKNINIHGENEDQLVFRFEVTPQACNAYQSLHGAMFGSLADVFTTVHLWGINPDLSHVSVDLDMRFMKGATLGTTVDCVTRVVRMGKRLGFAEFTFVDSKDHSILFAKGSHTKAIV